MKHFYTGLTLTLLLAGPALAQTQPADRGAHHAAATTTADMTAAEVRKVDKAAGKLTLKHEAIKNLDMPGMTMVFQVKDKAVLETLKIGDKVKFKAIDEAGKFTVTEIEAAK